MQIRPVAEPDLHRKAGLVPSFLLMRRCTDPTEPITRLDSVGLAGGVTLHASLFGRKWAAEVVVVVLQGSPAPRNRALADVASVDRNGLEMVNECQPLGTALGTRIRLAWWDMRPKLCSCDATRNTGKSAFEAPNTDG
jgi:hypothetical protein